MHGPCKCIQTLMDTAKLTSTVNWYRTRESNFNDEKNLKRRTMEQPVLYVLANKDIVLTREMSAGMDKLVPNLTRREVTAGHWALWEAADELNEHLKDWFQTVVLGGKSTL